MKLYEEKILQEGLRDALSVAGGVSQQELADHADWSESWVSVQLNGRGKLQPELVVHALDLLAQKAAAARIAQKAEGSLLIRHA